MKSVRFESELHLFLVVFDSVRSLQPLASVALGDFQQRRLNLLLAYLLALIVVTGSDLPFQCFVLAVRGHLFRSLMVLILPHLCLRLVMSEY